MVNGVKLEDGKYGRRAVITSSWHEVMTSYLLANHVVELELNDGKGWRGANIDFLEQLPELRSFQILDFPISSVEPIHFLKKLRVLQVSTYCRTEIRFSSFPQLEECSLEWRPKADSLFECTTLKKLFVNRYRGRDTEPFGRLIELQDLAILNAPVANLNGLRSLERVRNLRLAVLTKLTSLDGIEALVNLEQLDINTCRRIRSIEAVRFLPKLRKLFVDNSGEIESLKPIRELRNLEAVIFYESTNILDGDLSPLLNRPNLTRVSFQNRRHYSHRREQFARSTITKD
jgi:hypothetical protein